MHICTYVYMFVWSPTGGPQSRKLGPGYSHFSKIIASQVVPLAWLQVAHSGVRWAGSACVSVCGCLASGLGCLAACQGLLCACGCWPTSLTLHVLPVKPPHRRLLRQRTPFRPPGGWPTFQFGHLSGPLVRQKKCVWPIVGRCSARFRPILAPILAPISAPILGAEVGPILVPEGLKSGGGFIRGFFSPIFQRPDWFWIVRKT